jgi:hypothetical protein
MATVQITIPDPVVGRVLDAFDASYEGRPGNVSQAQWARLQVAHYVREVTIAYERRLAAEQAAATAEQTAETDIIID